MALGSLAPGRAGDPLFGPGSVVWRVARERALLLGGPATLLLQLAHPLVAAGVAGHSDFQRDPMRRLVGTMNVTLTITFGDREQAAAAAAAVRRVDSNIVGELPRAGLLLPTRLRVAYRLPPVPRAAARPLRPAVRLLPPTARYWPSYFRALDRLDAAD